MVVESCRSQEPGGAAWEPGKGNRALQVGKSVVQRQLACLSTAKRAGGGGDRQGWGRNNRPPGPRGFQTWDMDQDFKQGIFCLPRGDGMAGGGGGYRCSGFRTGAGATLVPLLHRDSEAASGEPVGPQGFLR